MIGDSWYHDRMLGYEGRAWVCYFWFVGWDCVSLGVHVCLSAPNVELHLPFGFIRVGIKSDRRIALFYRGFSFFGAWSRRFYPVYRSRANECEVSKRRIPGGVDVRAGDVLHSEGGGVARATNARESGHQTRGDQGGEKSCRS